MLNFYCCIYLLIYLSLLPSTRFFNQLRPNLSFLVIIRWYSFLYSLPPIPGPMSSWTCLFFSPSEFQVRDRFVMQFGGFCKVCTIHVKQLFLISSSNGSWLVLSHNSLLMIVSKQQILSVLRKQLFTNTCAFLLMVVVVFYITPP